MGLVVELPLLASTTTEPTPSIAGSPTVPGDLFQALLATLAPKPSQSTDTPTAPIPAEPPTSRKHEPITELALAFVPVLQLPTATGAPNSPAAPTSPTSAPTQQLPAAAPIETPPAVPSDSGAPAPLAARPPGDQPPNPAEPTTVAPTNHPSAAAPEPPAATQTAPILPPTAGPATDAHPGQPTQSDATPQPTEPDSPAAAGQPAQPGAPPLPAHIAEQPSPQGVVRPVGNAKAETETQQRPGPAAPEHRPLPRAAEPAIQHAAPNSAVAQLRESAPAPSASAPQPTPPAPEPAPQAIQNLDALATTVIERVEAGGGEARIHLEPAGLGEITIHLHARHDAVHLDVHAETPEAVQLLRDAATDLSSLLGQRGLNLAGLDIGLGSRSGGGGTPWTSDTPPRPQAAPGQFAALLGIDDTAALAREQRLRAAYNPDGSLLYRI